MYVGEEWWEAREAGTYHSSSVGPPSPGLQGKFPKLCASAGPVLNHDPAYVIRLVSADRPALEQTTVVFPRQPGGGVLRSKAGTCGDPGDPGTQDRSRFWIWSHREVLQALNRRASITGLMPTAEDSPSRSPGWGGDTYSSGMVVVGQHLGDRDMINERGRTSCLIQQGLVSAAQPGRGRQQEEIRHKGFQWVRKG